MLGHRLQYLLLFIRISTSFKIARVAGKHLMGEVNSLTSSLFPSWAGTHYGRLEIIVRGNLSRG